METVISFFQTCVIFINVIEVLVLCVTSAAPLRAYFDGVLDFPGGKEFIPLLIVILHSCTGIWV